MNRVLRTAIITAGAIGIAVAIGTATLASAKILAEKQVQALAKDCHSHDEDHAPTARLGWLDFFRPSTVEANDDTDDSGGHPA